MESSVWDRSSVNSSDEEADWRANAQDDGTMSWLPGLPAHPQNCCCSLALLWDATVPSRIKWLRLQVTPGWLAKLN